MCLLALSLAAGVSACRHAATPASAVPLPTGVDGMPQVLVPAGAFRMGSALLDRQRFGVEKPRHTVYLDAYHIDQREVTNGMFAQFVRETAYQTASIRKGRAAHWQVWKSTRSFM
jgi:formylglycine-generating enzyme required for sulfatase activity